MYYARMEDVTWGEPGRTFARFVALSVKQVRDHEPSGILSTQIPRGDWNPTNRAAPFADPISNKSRFVILRVLPHDSHGELFEDL